MTYEIKFTLTKDGMTLAKVMRSIEYGIIDAAMIAAGNSKREAAAILGLNRTTLVEKIKARLKRETVKC